MSSFSTDNSLSDIAYKIWFGEDAKKVITKKFAKEMIDSRRSGNKIPMFPPDPVADKNIVKLLWKILPIFKPLPNDLMDKINVEVERDLLRNLNTSEDGYIKAFNFYKSYDLDDDSIASIFIYIILFDNIIDGKPKNVKGLSKLFGKMSEHAFRYILLLDSY